MIDRDILKELGWSDDLVAEALRAAEEARQDQEAYAASIAQVELSTDELADVTSIEQRGAAPAGVTSVYVK